MSTDVQNPAELRAAVATGSSMEQARSSGRDPASLTGDRDPDHIPIDRSSTKRTIVAVVLLAGVLPALVGLSAYFLVGATPHVQDTLHECLELVGSCVAIFVAMLLLLRLRHEKASPHLLWVVAALLAMGLVDAVHGVHGITASSWLRHGATLLGGTLFGLVWLPLSPAVTRRKGLFVFVVAALVLAVAAGLWFRSEWLPMAWDPAGFYTLPVKAANGLGGLGFLAAALFFLRRYLIQAETEDLAFGSLTLLFGTAALLFGFSHTWAADWWIWHGFRLLAYVIVLVAAYEMIVKLYEQSARNAQELERRVQERTADLRASEERFRTMVDAIPQLAWMAQPDGFIFWYNQRWYEFTGTTPKQMEGWGWQSVHDPEMLPKVLERWKASIATGQPFEMHFPLRGSDGGFHWFLTRVFPLKDASGNIVRWFGTNTDVSQMREAEERIRLLNASLEERVAKRTADLESANKELEAFSYSVSHDLRAPLRGVDSFSRIILEDYSQSLDDEGKRLLNIVRGEAQRMGRLIDDLLSFSRMGRQEMQLAECDMATLAREALGSLDLSKRSIHLDVMPVPHAFGDLAMLRQVLFNLLSNAVKFTRHQSEPAIEFGGATADGSTTYYVKDNGVGFDPRFAHKLFKVFQRLHTEEEFEGTGVGLALVQRIVHRHGGKVWSEGDLNQGATFYFSLPTRKEV